MNDTDNSNSSDQASAESRQAANQEYEISIGYANRALKLSHAHKIPPVPKAYEVWYTYVSGSNMAVRTRVDKIIENNTPFSPYDIDLIHSEFLSSASGSAKSNDEAAAKFDQQMSEIIDLVQTHVESGDDYSGSLNKSNNDLTDAETPTQIRQIVEFLIAENTKMRDKTSDLTSNLKRSKKQIQNMQAKLKKAQENEMRDSLTNIANRRWFEQALTKEVAAAKANGAPLCLALVDIDHFKRVNDSYGHVIGDQVLKFFGSLLTKNVKGGDTAARYGGEEFAIILPATEIDNARLLLENIRSQLESAKLSLTKSRKSIGTVTASFGITQMRGSDDIEAFVKRADSRLYMAKGAGRNRIAGDGDK